MSEQTWPLLAKTNESNNILDIRTSEFVYEEGWTEIGTYDKREYIEPVVNENNIPLYKIEDGEKIERSVEEIANEENINEKLAALLATDLTMTRETEDTIDSMTDTQKARLPQYRLDLYNEKKAIRTAYFEAAGIEE